MFHHSGGWALHTMVCYGFIWPLKTAGRVHGLNDPTCRKVAAEYYSIDLLPSVRPPSWPPWSNRHLWRILNMQLCIAAGCQEAFLQTQHR